MVRERRYTVLKLGTQYMSMRKTVGSTPDTFKESTCVFCMTIANVKLSRKCGNLNRSGTSPGIIGIWE